MLITVKLNACYGVKNSKNTPIKNCLALVLMINQDFNDIGLNKHIVRIYNISKEFVK